jgi:hypothetical protein
MFPWIIAHQNDVDRYTLSWNIEDMTGTPVNMIKFVLA